MLVPVPTYQKRCRITIGIYAKEPFELGINAFDATRHSTSYFRRKVQFKSPGYREITIPLPISPEVLSVRLYDKKKHHYDADTFQVEKFDLLELPLAEVWAEPHMHDFIAFAQGFCEKAGYTHTGFHHSDDYRFLIHYLPEITDQFGQVMVTPARVNRVTGRHQVSQVLFEQFTIPVRLFILLHERHHFTIPTREEKPADLEALKLYLDLGYPTIEAVYAMTQVFMMNPESIGAAHVTRTKDVIDFIDAYKRKQAAA